MLIFHIRLNLFWCNLKRMDTAEPQTNSQRPPARCLTEGLKYFQFARSSSSVSPGVFYFDLFWPWVSDVFGRCDRHQRSKQIKTKYSRTQVIKKTIELGTLETFSICVACHPAGTFESELISIHFFLLFSARCICTVHWVESIFSWV